MAQRCVVPTRRRLEVEILLAARVAASIDSRKPMSRSLRVASIGCLVRFERYSAGRFLGSIEGQGANRGLPKESLRARSPPLTPLVPEVAVRIDISYRKLITFVQSV
jgi:hypothetical protein